MFVDNTRDQTFEVALCICAEAITNQIKKMLTDEQGMALRLSEAMVYSALAGGKRIRGFLTLEAALLCAQSQCVQDKRIQFKWDESALRVAAAIELFHTYSLIHDDLPAMDNAPLRRGQASAHIAFDEATAILSGDALQALAFEILSASNTHPDAETRSRLVHGLACSGGGRAGMAAGQMLDIIAETDPPDLKGLQELQSLKTGALIIFSCMAGGFVTGASRAELEALHLYGECIGQTFQITDDLLDLNAKSTDIGKPIGQDATAGKATYPALLGEVETRRRADDLTQQAKESLKVFSNAGHLPALAEYILLRRA